MNHAGRRKQWGQLLPALMLQRPHPLGQGRGSICRRRLLGAFGAAALSGLAPTISRAATSPIAARDGDRLEVKPGLLGPQLIAAGAIDPSRFAQACASAGEPLGPVRTGVLHVGSDTAIAFDPSNAHFLLNFFWAVGLANANPILTRGPMIQNGLARIAAYASTGGWTLTARPVTQVYASVPLVSLTAEQQTRLEEVASNVFRPCCDNPTSFPDCNHGMAMLGLLTRLAAEDRSVDTLFLAAKTANRFWFPQQSERVALFVQASQGIEYARLDTREASGRALFSGSGFRKVEAWLRDRGLGGSARGASCAA